MAVIGYVPSGTFELESGNGDQPLYGTTASGMHPERLIGEFL
jgi:hypothetical protein